MLGHLAADDAPPYTSGLLIGAEVAARLAEYDAEPVYILANPRLGMLYAAAIERAGRSATVIDSNAAFVGGIVQIEGFLP